ncbi:IPT/TIG domain-containing protein, partial [Baffinella frigidus]
MSAGARAGRWGALLAVAAACLGSAAAQPNLPIVDDVNPANGPTGGGTIITISGRNFGGGSSSVQPTISLGGAPCPQVVWVSATSVLCETPEGVGAHKAILVDVDGKTSVKNANSQFLYDAPTVIAIEPGHGSAAGGTMVTIIGSNFGESNNNPSVTIGGRPCQSVVWLSNSKLQCVSPPGIGIGDVRVFVLDQSSPENFGTIFEFDAPSIEELSPAHGPATGGFYITVQGVNFGTVDSHPSIKIGGDPCKVTAWKSNTQVICVAPSGSGQDKQVSVEILGQPSKPTPGGVFSYDGPTITSLEPGNGPTIGGTRVTLLGNNFGDAASSNTAVKVGNIPCSSATWESESSLVCITPSGVGGDNQIEVGMNGLHSDTCSKVEVAQGKCGSVFKYNRPAIQQVIPDHGPTTGGYEISVAGDNFGTTPSSLSLFVGKVACSRTGWVSNTMATCRVPQGVGATHVVVEVQDQRSGVGDDGSLSAAEGDLFTYNAPSVVDVLPRQGNPEGGQLVTVEGANFGVDKSQVEVLVGDRPGRVVHVGETRILMVMPPGEGDRAVSVTVGGISSDGSAAGGAAGGGGG